MNSINVVGNNGSSSSFSNTSVNFGASTQLNVLGNISLSGDILPTGNHTQNIGSFNNRFGTAWVDTLHIASNTLYLGETPVLGTNNDTVTIRADVDQSINIRTTGNGATQLISASMVDVSSAGTNIHCSYATMARY